MSNEASTSRSPAKQTSERRTTTRVQDPPIITIKVISQHNGTQINYQMRKSCKLGTLMTAYGNRHHEDPDSVIFLFEGRRLNKEQTPAEVGIEHEDEIDVVQHMTGGGGSFILLN